MHVSSHVAAVHVLDFLCALVTPGLGDLESLKCFLLGLQVLVPRTPALIQVASVIDEMHCDNLQKQLAAIVRCRSSESSLFVQIPVSRVSLRRIHEVSVLIPIVLRELVATMVCPPLPPHQNCPCARSSCTFAVCSECFLIYAACWIVHGRIGECVVTAKDGILSFITARYVLASPHGFLRCSIALMALCLCRSRTHLAVVATTWGMSIFLESDTIVAWMAPEEVSVPTSNTLLRCRELPRRRWASRSFMTQSH